jgi:aminopeptidase C
LSAGLLGARELVVRGKDSLSNWKSTFPHSWLITGTFWLSITSRPELPALEKQASRLFRHILSKYHISAQKKRSQNCWEFAAISAVQQFEKSFQEGMYRYSARRLLYPGQLLL